MNGWQMLGGLLFLGALVAVDAWNDHSSRRPLTWTEFRGREFWTLRRTKRERARVAISVGKEG